MATYSRSGAIAVVMALLSVGATIAHAQPGAPAARLAAEQWVALVDEGHADKSWRQAAASFKSVTPIGGWSFSVERIRHVLGPLTSRTFKSSTSADELPTGQRGKFVVVRFDSRFERHLGTTFETIATIREADGQWRVIWYDAK